MFSIVKKMPTAHDLTLAEEELHILDVRRAPIRRQALDEYFAIPLGADAVVEQYHHPAVFQRADQPPEALLQGDHRRRNLIVKEGITPIGIDGIHARRHHRIIRDREW